MNHFAVKRNTHRHGKQRTDKEKYMIQDIAPSVLNIAYRKDAVPAEDSCIVVFRDGKVLLRKTGEEIDFPRYRDLICTDRERLIYLFEISWLQFFFYDSDEAGVSGDFEYLEPWIFRTVKPSYMAYALVTARHICSWYASERFCGRCGARMEHDANERMMSCPECGNHVYPVISPAVIVGVTDGDRLLLTRYASRPGTPSALVAGFNEVGETIEETVIREVMEETGLSVTDIRYYKSQPWGITGGLLFGFWGRLDGSDAVTLNDGELGEAVWMTRQEISDTVPPDDISLTREMIAVFSKGYDPYE